MSSLVSMRSYEKRRKSAGARLERYQTPLPTLAITPPEEELSGRDPATGEQGNKSLAPKVPERRAMSARERKREHEASDIFPETDKNKTDPEWGITKYSEDFGPKSILTPVPVRPISPTRMNNPHPANAFMKWKHPVRIHKHKKAVPPPPDSWRYITEGFYDDYTDTYNTGDAKNEVAVTNLAKIEFPGKTSKKKEYTSTPHLLGGVMGTKAKLNQRYSSKENANGPSLKPLRPPSPQSRMMQNTLKGNTLPVFKQWLKSASTTERDVVLKMLQAASDDSEESRMNKALFQVLQGDSAENVQAWLRNASESERQVVLRVLETLAIAASDNDFASQSQPIGMQLLQPTNYYMNGFGHHRGHTYPITLRGRRATPHPHASRSHSRHGHRHSRHGSHQSSRSRLSDGSEQSAVLSQHSGFGLVGRKITRTHKDGESASKSKSSKVNPELWQNRILKKHTGASHFHAAGVFSQPHKDKGQHFNIHPEWPTA